MKTTVKARSSDLLWMLEKQVCTENVRFREVLRASLLLLESLLLPLKDSISEARSRALRCNPEVPRLLFVVVPGALLFGSKRLRSLLARFLTKCLPDSLDLVFINDVVDGWRFLIRPIHEEAGPEVEDTLDFIVEESDRMVERLAEFLKNMKAFRWSNVKWECKPGRNTDLWNAGSVPGSPAGSFPTEDHLSLLFPMTIRSLGLNKHEFGWIRFEGWMLVTLPKSRLALLSREIPGLLGDLRVAQR